MKTEVKKLYQNNLKKIRQMSEEADQTISKLKKTINETKEIIKKSHKKGGKND